MIRTIALAAALFAASVSAATPQPTVHKVVVRKTIAADGTTKTIVTGDPAARALIANCGARRFETVAQVDNGAGGKRLTKIKLCARPGEDDAAWLKSLRSARATIKGTTTLPQITRTSIIADLDAEIAKVQASSGAKPTAADPLAPAAPK
ncbi:MAG: hypothetical protein ABIR77_04135 [Sphingomicrobium sp.]